MRPQLDQRGFGLVEVMVGMLIGLLASIVVFQVFSVSERQKRTTTGSADAQSNAAFALYAIERDAKMAGFGLEADAIAKCDEVFSYRDTGSGDGSIPEFDIPAAVNITDGGGSVPDEIEIVYYTDPTDGNFIVPGNTTLRSTMPSSSAELNVSSTSGCVEGTLAIAQQDGKCTVMEITQVQGSALKLQHNPGGAGSVADPQYNPSIPYMNAHNWPAYTMGATVRCGLTPPISRTYRINANVLQSRDSTSVAFETITPNIVALQAQYGVADAGSLAVNRADQWVDATGIWKYTDTDKVLTRANGKRIKAIRVAVAARSSEYEKPESGGACTTTTDEMVKNWSSWADLSAVKNLADWQCYRYKVVETVVPLRNVIWANLK